MSQNTQDPGLRAALISKIAEARRYADREGFELSTVCLSHEATDLVLAALSATPAHAPGKAGDREGLEQVLRELSDRATPGEWHVDWHPTWNEDNGAPEPDICEGICIHTPEHEAESVLCCSEHEAAFIAALVNAYRSGSLAPSPTGNEASRGVVPAGWKLVPVEPTKEMFEACWRHSGESHEMRARTNAVCAGRYRAMLAAAPPPPVSPQPDSPAPAPSGAEREALQMALDALEGIAKDVGACDWLNDADHSPIPTIRAALAPAVSGSGEPDSRAGVERAAEFREALDAYDEAIRDEVREARRSSGAYRNRCLDLRRERRAELDRLIATISSAPTASEAAAPVGGIRFPIETTSWRDTPRPTDSNADAWNVWLSEHRDFGSAYLCVQIADALDDFAAKAVEGIPKLDWMGAMRIVQAGWATWAAKPHNARWVRKIDGTPIPNDLAVNIAQAFADAEAASPTPPSPVGRPQPETGQGDAGERGMANVMEALWRDAEEETQRLRDGFWPSDEAIAEAFHEHRRERQAGLPPWSGVQPESGMWRYAHNFAARLCSLRPTTATTAEGTSLSGEDGR